MEDFQIYEEIGRGRYSVVYKARQKKTINYAAVKCVDKAYKAKVTNEVRILNVMDHPNVLKFFNWYETNNHYWIIVEYCSGGDLMNLLMQDQSLPEETVHLFSLDLVRGLQYCHSKGIIYCDLKPSNVLIDGCGVLKLSDFGLAQPTKDAEAETSPSGRPKRGSPCYMAPELFQGGWHSYYSDFWSLGCVLYELASGQPPFVGQTFEELVDLILNEEVKPLPNHSAELNDLLRGLLQKDPKDRLRWEELREHDFWKEKIEPPVDEIKYPPPFSLAPTEDEEEEEKQTNERKDVLRLSRIVKSNLEKEQGSSYENGNEDGIRKIGKNTDMEYNFEEDNNDEKGESTTDIDETDSVINISQNTPSTGNVIAERKYEQPNTSRIKAPAQSEGSPRSVPSLALGSAVSLPTPGTAREYKKAVPEDIHKLIYHPSDNYVKPIVLNARIEKITETKYDKETLPFTPYTLDQVLKLSQSELEKFLTIVYKCIGGQTEVNAKVNTLCYFETLCTNTHSANMLINSSLMKLFVKMLKLYKSPMLKCQLCSVMGVLMRHATFISNDLAKTEIFDIFLEHFKEKNAKVKRKVIACLGELMFYIATQQQEGTQQKQEEAWTVPPQVITGIIKILKTNDEVTQHYATKTVENIGGQSKQYAQKFATEETVANLYSVFQTATDQFLRGSAISALSRLCRHKTAMSGQMIDKITIKMITTLMKDSNSRVQQSAINIINSCLYHEPNSRVAKQLADDPNFVTSAIELIENSSVPVVRGKALLTMYFLFKINTSLIIKNCETRFAGVLDRLLAKEKDVYVLNCSDLLIDVIGEALPPLLKEITQSLESSVKSSGKKQTVDSSKLNVVLVIITTPCLSQRVVNAEVIKYLSRCLFVTDTSASFEGFTKVFLLIIEALSGQQSVLSHHTAVVESLLPALINMLKSEIGDIRFLCLKIFTDILVRYLNDPSIYNAFEGSKDTTFSINNFIIKNLLPQYRNILEDQDPIPLYGLKLLNNIAQHNPGFISVISKMELTSLIFNFFELEHRNNNVHNVRLILKIVSADVMDVDQMYRMGIVNKLNAVLAYAFDNGVDTFYESCLGICDHLLYRVSKLIHKSKGGSTTEREQTDKMYKYNEALTQNCRVYVALCSHQDPFVAEASAHVLLMIVQQYASTHDYLFSSTGLANFKKGLLENMAQEETEEGETLKLMNQNVVKSLLKCLQVVIQANYKYAHRLQREEMIRLAIERLANEYEKGDELTTCAESIIKTLTDK